MRDRAKASSTGSKLDLLRSKYFRMDETALAASSALRSKESPSSPVSKPFLFNSSDLEEDGLTLYAGGFQTVMGMTASGCSTALPEEPFAFATYSERDCGLEALGTSAGGGNICPDVRMEVEGEEEDALNFGTFSQVGRSFSTKSEVFRFTLRGFRDSVSIRARSSPLVGLAAEGPMGETFTVKRGEGLKTAEQADLELEGPEIFDLISFA